MIPVEWSVDVIQLRSTRCRTPGLDHGIAQVEDL